MNYEYLIIYEIATQLRFHFNVFVACKSSLSIFLSMEKVVHHVVHFRAICYSLMDHSDISTNFE
jgi:hypothetical protein